MPQIDSTLQQTSIKIYTCHTPSHAGIFEDYFLASLPGSLVLQSKVIAARESSDFGTPGFLQAIADKVELIKASINENIGSFIIWSDVDIVFLRDPAEEISAIVAGHPDTDLWFQRETSKPEKDVNAGFVVMRCTDKVDAFFRTVLALMRENPKLSDQDAINHLLQGNCEVIWDYLPGEFYARSHGWPPKVRITLYHANCTMGEDAVGQKVRQFGQLRKLEKYGIFYKAAVKLKKAGLKIRKAAKRISSRLS
jgi:hypothetical protein